MEPNVEAVEFDKADFDGTLSKFTSICCEYLNKNKVVDSVRINGRTWAHVLNWGRSVVDEGTQRELLTSGLLGHASTADFYLDNDVPDNTLMIHAQELPKKFSDRFTQKLKNHLQTLEDKADTEV